MEDIETKNEMYDINDVSQLTNPVEIMRFMVMFFRIYDNEYFDIFKCHSMDEVHSYLERFDEFMRKSMIQYPYKSELSSEIKTKDMTLVDAVVHLHSKLVNLHLGFKSITAIEDLSSSQVLKRHDIRQEAVDTHHLLLNISQSVKKEMTKISDKKVFFTEEEYPNYETKAKLPTASRRERRAKKHGH